jgi:hypothetical protein
MGGCGVAPTWFGQPSMTACTKDRLPRSHKSWGVEG